MSTGWHGERGRAPELVFVVAVADNGVIGRDNALPWRLKDDLKRFRALTIGRPVIMGRKTYESIGKPLVNRLNIVVSRQAGYAAPGVLSVHSIAAALDAAQAEALRRNVDEIAVIGGRDIFALLMDRVDRIALTRVHAEPEGDVFFPPLDMTKWMEGERVSLPADADNSAATTYAMLRRAAPA